MKRTFFIFFLLIVSCSDKEKELVNYQSLIEQGEKINLLNTINLNLKNEQKINKLINSKYHIYKGWPEEGQNSKNLITSTRISIADKKKKSINQNIHKSLFDCICSMKFSMEPSGCTAKYCFNYFYTSSFDMPKLTIDSRVSASITILLSLLVESLFFPPW